MPSIEIRIDIGPPSGSVSGLLRRPAAARCLYVMAHGAGAGMRHRFMEAAAAAFAAVGIATLRFNFPAMEAGRKRPDRPEVAQQAVRAAVERGQAEAPDLPHFAGGKSFGGRMTSSAAAQAPLAQVRGLIFLGFPLHPAGRPGTARAEHLADLALPMLFLQGTRDALAEPELIREVCEGLGGRSTLRMIDGADHSFAVLKRSGRTEEEVLEELAESAGAWIRRVLGEG